jgi:hypothetical protein
VRSSNNVARDRAAWGLWVPDLDPSREREQRRAMLRVRPHMIELAKYAERLRRPGVEVPDFDPLDGGVEALVVFLFEKSRSV